MNAVPGIYDKLKIFCIFCRSEIFLMRPSWLGALVAGKKMDEFSSNDF